MPNKKSLTLNDVAAACGFDRTTVSRALKGDSRVAEKTRLRIFSVAQELGYQANPMVSAWMAHIRSNKSLQDQGVIAGLVAGWKNIAQFRRNPNAHALVSGAKARSEELGYSLEFLQYDAPDMTAKRFHQILLSRGIRGVLFFDTPGPSVSIDLDIECFACAGIGYGVTGRNVHRAASNSIESVDVALARLQQRGIHKVGLALHSNDCPARNHIWISSYCGWREFVPESRNIPVCIFNSDSSDIYCEWYEKWKPDAILYSEDPALRLIMHMGKKPGKDISMVKLNIHSHDRDGLTGLLLDLPAVGAAGIDLVAGQLLRNERGTPDNIMNVRLNGIWQEGTTLVDNNIDFKEEISA